MIATVTMNPYLEYFLQVDRLPPNTNVPVKGTAYSLGGIGLNVSRMASRLKAETCAYGLLGGHMGELIKQGLDAESVPHDFVDSGAEPRQDVTVILMTDRSRVHLRTAGPELDTKLGDALKKHLLALDPKPKFLVFGGGVPGREIPPRIAREYYSQVITDYRKHADVKVAIDASGAELGHSIERGPYLVSASEDEMRGLAKGHTLQDDKDFITAAQTKMREHGVEIFLISRGKAGSLVVRKDAAPFKAIPPSVDGLSTTGAGASLLAGVLVGLGQGKDLEGAVALGTAAGAATAATVTTELPTADVVEKLLPNVRIEKI
jgi:1-phosphofructokinase family hexose kinase